MRSKQMKNEKKKRVSEEVFEDVIFVESQQQGISK